MRLDSESETFIPEVAPCLTRNYGKQPDNSDTNAGPMLVATVAIGLDEEQNANIDLFGCLKARMEGGGFEGCVLPPAVCFTERGRKDGRNLESQEDLAYALTNPGSGGRTHSRQLMTPQMAVRRLTPTECERLQGYRDGFTAVSYRGKTAADGPRYKALGNSMAVPCVRWILARIAAVAHRAAHGATSGGRW